MRETAAQLSPATRHAVDALIKTQTPENPADTEQMPLFPIRSELAMVKDDAGAVSVETVLDEIAKLQQLRALGLPEGLFRGAPAKLVTHYRQRAASEPPRELRRHPPDVRHALLAALCWQRQQEITDSLIELLIHIAHRVGVRAEEKVDIELLKYAKKVVGKARLLYKLAKAAKAQPDGIVRDVIYPAVGEKTLEELIQEVEAAEKHERQVKLVTRASYSHHYRRIVPALLEALSFQCNNELHRPVMDALALLYKYRDRKATVFPASEKVPLDGVVSDDWQELVRDDKHGGAINRISYEWCVLTTLREKVRCKEVWVKGAHRFRNPDEDLPQDFDVRRDEYYAALKQPREARVFVEELRHKMETALAAFNASLPDQCQSQARHHKERERPDWLDAAGRATRAAQHCGADGRFGAALADDQLAGHSERNRTAGAASRRHSARSAPERCSSRKYYSAACCCAFTASAPMRVLSACAAGEARTGTPTCSTFVGGTSRKSSYGRRSRECATPFSASAIRFCGARERLHAHQTRNSSGRGIRI